MTDHMSTPEQGDPADEPGLLHVWRDDGGRWHDVNPRSTPPELAARAIPVVPLERALKAEEAARDLLEALDGIARQDATCRLGDPPWKHWRTRAVEALARHPGFLPTPTEKERG